MPVTQLLFDRVITRKSSSAFELNNDRIERAVLLTRRRG
jgi:hypothetical protein